MAVARALREGERLSRGRRSHTSAKRGGMQAESIEAETAAVSPIDTSDQSEEQSQNAQGDERMDSGAPKGSSECEQTVCESVMRRG